MGCLDLCLSVLFSVSNGVGLFAVYLDSLLVDLNNSGVGCYWGCCFACAFTYVEDVVQLAPFVSALRKQSRT